MTCILCSLVCRVFPRRTKCYLLIVTVVSNGCTMNENISNVNPIGGTLVTMQPVGKPKPLSVDDVGNAVPDDVGLGCDQPVVRENSDTKDDKK